MNTVRHSLGFTLALAVWLIGTTWCVGGQSSKDQPHDAPASSPLRFELVAGVEPATIVLAKGEHPGVLAAAKDLQRDVTKITGVTPNIVHSLGDCAEKCVVLGSADCPEGKTLLASVGVNVDDLTGKWETYKWRVLNDVGGKQQVLAVAGSNVRGTIFGVYEFERMHMHVDPFWFWADHEPPTRGELVFDNRVDFGPAKEPTWKYRGWTLNDHPQFMEWIESGLVQRARYSRYMFAIHHEVLQRLMEAALRLRMNMFTWYFLDIEWQPDRERLQAVADRGLFLTQHQMEGVGADTGYWDDYWRIHNPSGKPNEFSYRLHPEAFRQFWTFYIRRWAAFSPQVVWEINLRGWADGPYDEPSLPNGGTRRQRGELITKALADQARLVRQYDPNPQLEMMTTLYAEVGKLYDDGLVEVPEGVTTDFADAGMSGMAYSKKFWTEPRNPSHKYGQYFHTQYFGGGPQIAKCTPVEQYIKVNMDAMFQRGDTQHMLLAMNELRHQQIEIRAVAEMLWDYPGFKPRQYLLGYCRDEFGEPVAQQVLALYDEYYAKYPHDMRDDSFKTIPYYHKVMEPLFTVIENLLNIESGTRDGFVINYRYNREAYEQGIRDLGGVLEKAIALRESIPPDRRSFFDYEFIDAIRQIRGIYKASLAANDAIASLKKGDRRTALAALLDAKPLVDELYAAYQNNCAGEKWQHWYRSGTNEDVHLLVNLYQKARLRLEVESMDPVTDIQPQRHPYLGNVVMHDPAEVGDPVYSSQAERLNQSMWNGSPFSLLSFPLHDVFQIGGVQSRDSKQKRAVADYGLTYSFRLQSPSRVYVAKEQGQKLDWLAADHFRPEGQTFQVGHWGWPYRYRNRPPDKVHTFEIFAKDFPAGQVSLGKQPAAGDGLPYIVFVRPAILAYENFHDCPVGSRPPGWRIDPNGGLVDVVPNPDYEGRMRDSVFDLSTVRRYRPLGLKSLRLATTPHSTAGCAAEIPFRQPVDRPLVVHLRVKPGQTNRPTTVSLQTKGDTPVAAILFDQNGRITSPLANDKAAGSASYQADRWYNLKLRIDPEAGRCQLSVQDDRLNDVYRLESSLIEAQAVPAKVRVSHGSAGAASSIVLDAMVAWLE